LPTFDGQGTLQVSPYRILDHLHVHKRGRTITQVLIQWTTLPPKDAMWEEAHSLIFNLEDKVDLKVARMKSTTNNN